MGFEGDEMSRKAMGRTGLPLWTALVACVCLLVGAFVAPTIAGAQDADADAEAKADYISALEPVCAADARRNARILKGVRRQVADGKFQIAAQRFARATRAFTQTLRVVIRTPRPAADRQMLNQWLRLLIRQRSYLAQITRALARGDGFEAQRLSVLLVRNANQANMAVSGYGFRHCIIRPNQFL